MRLLLDAHALLWWAAEDAALAHGVRELIDGAETDVQVSSASIWEIAIKRAAGRLRAPDDLAAHLASQGVGELAVTWRHAGAAGALPRHHGDPFDRMLVAQAQLEGLSIVTADADIPRYAVHVVAARG